MRETLTCVRAHLVLGHDRAGVRGHDLGRDGEAAQLLLDAADVRGVVDGRPRRAGDAARGGRAVGSVHGMDRRLVEVGASPSRSGRGRRRPRPPRRGRATPGRRTPARSRRRAARLAAAAAVAGPTGVGWSSPVHTVRLIGAPPGGSAARRGCSSCRRRPRRRPSPGRARRLAGRLRLRRPAWRSWPGRRRRRRLRASASRAVAPTAPAGARDRAEELRSGRLNASSRPTTSARRAG